MVDPLFQTKIAGKKIIEQIQKEKIKPLSATPSIPISSKIEIIIKLPKSIESINNEDKIIFK